jgi:hypothetical protein
MEAETKRVFLVSSLGFPKPAQILMFWSNGLFFSLCWVDGWLKIYPPESWCCWSGRAWGSGNVSRAKGWGWSVDVDCHFGFAHRHPILGGFGKVDDFFGVLGK